jgi:hypothetical protein
MVSHLLTTRLRGPFGLLFAVWTALALTARLNFGEDPQLVTVAMSYNRVGAVLLSNLLVLFVPAARKDRRIGAIDAVWMAAIAFVLFYTKVTYGLCALAAIVLLAIYQWRDAWRSAVGGGVGVVPSCGRDHRDRVPFP